MARLTILALIFLAGTACSAPNRIVGGWEANLEDWPFIVQSDYFNPNEGYWAQFCGASIITSHHVLSAAHCYGGPPSNLRIRAGSANRNVGGTLHQVQWESHHPSLGQGLGFDGDICVLRVVSPFVFSPIVGQATIVSQNSQVPDGAAVQYAGWGFTTEGGDMSPELLETQVNTVNNAECAQIYEGFMPITPNMICTIYPDRDACQGDSGGPLTFSNILVGVVSWGRGCANGTNPGVATAVSSYTEWIVATAV